MKHQLERYTNATLEFNCHKKKCIKGKSRTGKQHPIKPESEDEEESR